MISLGKSVSAGLPALTGTLNGRGNQSGQFMETGTGALYGYKTGPGYPPNQWSENYSWCDSLGFNAASCNTIYGNSTTVTPKSLKVGMYIKY